MTQILLFARASVRNITRLNLVVLISALISACAGGGGASVSLGPTQSATQQAVTATASSASLAVTQSQTANNSVSTALLSLSGLVTSNSVLSSSTAVTASAAVAQQAVALATAAQTTAAVGVAPTPTRRTHSSIPRADSRAPSRTSPEGQVRRLSPGRCTS